MNAHSGRAKPRAIVHRGRGRGARGGRPVPTGTSFWGVSMAVVPLLETFARVPSLVEGHADEPIRATRVSWCTTPARMTSRWRSPSSSSCRCSTC